MATNGPAATNDAAAPAASNPSKDEVGWYFVESYYTTLAKNPERLHLFYSKRSQFVNGMEAEVANVSVGRQSIQERIKSLDFQDTRVRITNVDTQASFDNIVIQVIGESVHKSATEPKKFVQTFVLAPQNTGYWVVNDILRYMLEDDEEEEEEAAPAAAAEPEAQPEKEQPAVEEAAETAQPEAEVEAEAKVEKTPEETSAPAIDPTVVDKRLEEVSAAPQDVASSNGDAEPAAPEPVKAPETKVEAPAVDPETTAKEIAEEDIKEPEKPADPSPTPVVPTKAPAPTSWAGILKTNKVAVPIPKTATPPAGAKAKAPVPAAAAPQPAAPAAAPAPAAPAAKEPEAPAAKETSPSEWKSVDKRQNRPQSISQAPADNNGTLGYVKFVTEKVKAEDLKAALAAHGELTYFDINRQKNCAFVEFANATGYNAAVQNNPHIVNGEHIVVEPRRPKATAYGGSNYASGGRGNASGRGRGGFEGGNRSGGQSNPRGNFSGGQGRGRGSVRGRGASQTAA